MNIKISVRKKAEPHTIEGNENETQLFTQGESAPKHNIIRPLKLIRERTIFFLYFLPLEHLFSLSYSKENNIHSWKIKGREIIPPFLETLKWFIINHSKNIDKKREQTVVLYVLGAYTITGHECFTLQSHYYYFKRATLSINGKKKK